MGQYYMPYLRFMDGSEEKYSPHNALYMAMHDIDEVPENVPFGSFEDPESYGACFNGLKLTEHSWIGNTFMDGVLEAIEDRPARVAWVGDYAAESEDYTTLYTPAVYDKMWGEHELKDQPFKRVPEKHKDGYLINHSTYQYIDLEKYYEEGSKDGWCVHPLSLLTAIGNGRGGGDYARWNKPLLNQDMVGIWAMDIISYSHTAPEDYLELPNRQYVFDPAA